MLLTDTRAIAIYVKTSHFLNQLLSEESTNRSIILANNEGKIGRVWGAITEDISPGSYVIDIKSDDYYLIEKEIIRTSCIFIAIPRRVLY